MAVFLRLENFPGLKVHVNIWGSEWDALILKTILCTGGHCPLLLSIALELRAFLLFTLYKTECVYTITGTTKHKTQTLLSAWRQLETTSSVYLLMMDTQALDFSTVFLIYLWKSFLSLSHLETLETSLLKPTRIFPLSFS